MGDALRVTGWMVLRICAPIVAIGATLTRLAWGWPSGGALARVWLLAAVAWLAGLVGQRVDDAIRRRSHPLRDIDRSGGPRSGDRPGGRPTARRDYPR
jgi:hypothetical protein